jgi:phage-related protein (TIGR01555 family)
LAETSGTAGDQFDAERLDGVLTNAITGLGTKRDKNAYYGIRTQSHLSEEQLEALYYDPLCRRVVDIFAEAAISKPPTIKFAEEMEGHDDIIRSFEEYLDQTEFYHFVEEALKLQRIYGGAALFLVCDDGMDPTEPMDPRRLKNITDVVPLSKREIKPHDYNYLNYRRPDLYRISTSKSLNEHSDMQYMLVHSSRVLRFDGLYLPWKQRLNNDGWGLSFLQPFFEPYKRYRGGCDGLASMLNEFDLFVHKLPGLANKIAAGREAALKNRLEANSLARSIFGGMVLDSEESVEFLNRSLGGAQDIFDRLLDDLVAAADMPKPLLFGTSPAGGLSESGKYEDKVWASTVERYQNHSLRRALTRYFNLIFQMKSGPTGGVVPQGSWTVYFPPYFAQSDSDRANLRQQIALSDQIYMNAKVLTPMEIRASRFGGTEYSIDTVLHQEEEDRLIAMRELQHEAALEGFEGQRQRLENGNGDPVKEESDFEPTGFNADGEFLQMNGLTLSAGSTNGIYRVAEVLHPDGQVNDAEPVVLIGRRLEDPKIYRGFLKRDDETIEPGPLLMGFYSSRSASRALKDFVHSDSVSGLERLDAADLAHLKNTYVYEDDIEYAGHRFPGYNKPIRTPDHPEKSHAVLAKEGEQVKLIRFGQQGVKGSPKRKGESEASRKRREAFRARHAENIKKGKMSAAYWSARHKW